MDKRSLAISEHATAMRAQVSERDREREREKSKVNWGIAKSVFGEEHTEADIEISEPPWYTIFALLQVRVCVRAKDSEEDRDD